MERRLAAILSADVVGYSRLMEEDEDGTLSVLQAHRAELIDPTIAAHRGRIVKLMGDGALVEFASVVDAVESAVDVQRGVAERKPMSPRAGAFRFASASTSATWSSRGTTSTTTGSTSRRVFRNWPIRAACALRARSLNRLGGARTVRQGEGAWSVLRAPSAKPQEGSVSTWPCRKASSAIRRPECGFLFRLSARRRRANRLAPGSRRGRSRWPT